MSDTQDNAADQSQIASDAAADTGAPTTAPVTTPTPVLEEAPAATATAPAAPAPAPAPAVQSKSPTPTPKISSGAVVGAASDKVGIKATTAQVAAVAQAKKKSVQTGVFSEEAQALIDELTKSGNGIAINVFAGIEQYLKDMKPGRPMKSVDGARHQVLLYRTIQMAINQTKTDFPKVFATVLKVFADNQGKGGATNGQYLFRFTENLAMSPEDREGFTRLMNMLSVAAPVQNRAMALKQIDFPRTLQYGVSDEGRRRLLAFFNR